MGPVWPGTLKHDKLKSQIPKESSKAMRQGVELLSGELDLNYGLISDSAGHWAALC